MTRKYLIRANGEKDYVSAKGLEEIYAVLKCDEIDSYPLGPHLALYIDAVGAVCEPPKPVNKTFQELFATTAEFYGDILVVRTDDEGEDCDLLDDDVEQAKELLAQRQKKEEEIGAKLPPGAYYASVTLSGSWFPTF